MPQSGITVDVTGSGGFIATPSNGSDPNGYLTNGSGSATVEVTPGKYMVTPVNPHPALDFSFSPPTSQAKVSTSDVALTFKFVNDQPVVSQVTPNAGPVVGGTTITIVGTNFYQSGDPVVTGVNFSTPSGKILPAKSYTVLSNDKISAVTPKANSALQPNQGNIVSDTIVDTPKADSTANSSDQFNFGDVPVVTAVSPGDGPYTGGTKV